MLSMFPCFLLHRHRDLHPQNIQRFPLLRRTPPKLKMERDAHKNYSFNKFLRLQPTTLLGY